MFVREKTAFSVDFADILYKIYPFFAFSLIREILKVSPLSPRNRERAWMPLCSGSATTGVQALYYWRVTSSKQVM